MILQRLYELAVRENLMDDPAFEKMPVPYVVHYADDGKFLSIQDQRGTKTIPSKKKSGEPKTVIGDGQMYSIPRAHGNTAAAGFARFFVDTIARILPVTLEAKDEARSANSRKTFWEQIEQAASATQHPSLVALTKFGQRLTEFQEHIQQEMDQQKIDPKARMTFACFSVGGKIILEEEPVRAWYRGFYSQKMSDKLEGQDIGLCQVTKRMRPLPNSHAIKLQGIPGGLSTGASVVSFDKAAFGHYGLDKAANSGIGPEAAEGYLLALKAMLKNDLPKTKSKLTVGSTAFVYWTKTSSNLDFMQLFEEPADDAMGQLMDAVQGGKKGSASTLEDTPFYLLALSGNAARVIVRGYLEETLGNIKANILLWFQDLAIADASKDYAGKVNSKFPLWQLATATAFDANAMSPDTPERLLQAALTGGPVAESLLVACLRRLCVEGSEAFFRVSRMALIKLILIRRGIPVSEKLDEHHTRLAYHFGRLLCLFDQIQYAALNDVNATVVDKFYGTFSAAPALIFARLVANAQNHLRKLKGERPGQAFNLEKRLTEVMSQLGTEPPPARFGLQDQGLFAIGYYHEKAKRLEEAADRKAAKAAETEKQSS